MNLLKWTIVFILSLGAFAGMILTIHTFDTKDVGIWWMAWILSVYTSYQIANYIIKE